MAVTGAATEGDRKFGACPVAADGPEEPKSVDPELPTKRLPRMNRGPTPP